MKIAIIGGGAAGMMAAATVLEKAPETELFLIEKNSKLGTKVLISGGGRCNVTTGFSDLRFILDRYPRGAKFLQSALHHFPPGAVQEWFEAHGVPLKVEEDLRVFPVSNSGEDIVNVFEKLLQNKKDQLLLKQEVVDISKKGAGFKINFKADAPLDVDRLILTTGGQAYRHTGSTGEGYSFAEKLGHSITPLAPSLNAFVTKESWPKSLAGVSLPKVGLNVKTSKKYHYTGPILFTHRGLTGPAVFALSSYLAFESYSPEQPLLLHLDFFPFTKPNELENELQVALQENPKKTLKNTLSFWLPKSLATVFLELLNIPQDKQNINLNKKEQNRLLESLKKFPLNLIGRAAGEEFVTAGGIDLTEVNSSTMESKRCPGLYFAGEILNVDGFTGGYNLQAAWATGRLAGEHILW